MSDHTVTLINIFAVAFAATIGVKTGEVVWNKCITSFLKTKVEKGK